MFCQDKPFSCLLRWIKVNNSSYKEGKSTEL